MISMLHDHNNKNPTPGKQVFLYNTSSVGKRLHLTLTPHSPHISPSCTMIPQHPIPQSKHSASPKEVRLIGWIPRR
ncbi:hypothetical protein BKA80DRAFT_263934 [Phyllosticta citrichinensis]